MKQHKKKLGEDLVWNQPVNKSVKCLLPISKKFLSEPNAKQYWDGRCKRGYAYGLGRDIAISDYSHREEILYHDKNKKTDYGPFVFRDYLKKETIRGYRFGSYDDYNFLIKKEQILDDKENDRAALIYSGYYATKDGPCFYWAHENHETTIVSGIENNLMYIRYIYDNFVDNTKFANDFIGVIGDSPEVILGKTQTPVFFVFDAFGKRENKITRKGLIEYIKHPASTAYNQEAKEVLDRAQILLNQNDIFKKVEELEQRYALKLKQTKTPKGLSSEIYHEYNNYYEQDGFYERYKRTKQRFNENIQNARIAKEQQRIREQKARENSMIKTIDSLTRLLGSSL